LFFVFLPLLSFPLNKSADEQSMTEEANIYHIIQHFQKHLLTIHRFYGTFL